MPKVADVIAERYELLAHLGDGGTASVWRARDRTLEREVAIKFLYVADERDVDVMRKQFLREARIACAVKHRNVIQTMDFGQTDESRAYMVMELLRGEELTQRIGTNKKLTLSEAVHVISDVLRGLQAIHEAGIVHRDLKPENIYLERDQDGIYPKILDFGVAKAIDRRGNRRSVLTTKEGIVVGTPEYMSPEQARGQRDLDARADVWSVGVVLFELLTDKLPFDEPSEAEAIIKIVTTDAPRADAKNSQVPAAIADVIEKALKRDRNQRFQSASEMNQALLEALRGEVDTERPLSRAAARRRRAVLFLSSASVLALLAFVAMLSREQPAKSASDGKPRVITVELNGVPPQATVLVNGRRVTENPLHWQNDGYSRLIEVQAPGRTPWRVMHPAGNNGRYEVRMPELAPPPATPQPASEPAAVKDDPQHAHPRALVTAPRVSDSNGTARPKPSSADPNAKKKAPTVWRKLDF